MAYVTRLSGDAAQIEYRLGGGHGCDDRQVGYRTDDRERALRWIGRGLPAVGVTPGERFAEGDEDRARALMAGAHPLTGEQLVTRKLAVCDDAKVPLAPLVAAIRELAQQRRIAPSELLESDRAATAFQSAERAVERDGELATRRADEAGQLAEVAGLDVENVWDVAVFTDAVRNLSQTVTTVDEDGNKRSEQVPRRRPVGNVGYDFAFTLPKSMSLLLAFADEDTAERIEGLYSDQVGRTFAWVEDECAYQMRGHHGGGQRASVVAGSGFLGWTMVHRAARPVEGQEVGDPHWHVHVTLANMTQAEDGKWATVAAGGRDLMRHAPAADHVLKALTRHELATTFGVEFTRNRRSNAWEVGAIPDETLQVFSQRGMDIQRVLDQLGVTNATASHGHRNLAEFHDRGDKAVQSEASDATLRDHWQARAEATGHDVAGMVARVLAGEASPLDDLNVERVRAELADPDSGLTGHKRRFTKLDAVARVADSLEQGIGSVDELIAFTNHVLADPRFPAVGSGPDRGLNHEHLSSVSLSTTQDVIDSERIIIDRARSEAVMAAGAPEQIGPSLEIAEAGQGYPLSQSQRAAVLHLTSSTAAVDTLLGPPGTGKTTLLRAARIVWEGAGHRVAGAATAAIAAQNLEVEAGIASSTVASLVQRHKLGQEPLADVDVLVIDEANLTDDRARAQLYRMAGESRTKIVEVGDPRQLRGVGCGSSFGMLHQLTNGAELIENRRQRDAEERLAIQAWREGRYGDALDSWGDRGRLVVNDSLDETVAGMVATWRSETAGAPDVHDRIAGVLMVAASNAEVELINRSVQAVREDSGEIVDARDLAVDDGRELRVGIGDQVLLRLNDRTERLTSGAAVLNGYRGVVTGLGDDGGLDVEWRADTEDGPQLRNASLSAEYVAAGGVELGYAVTTHKAEGLTISADWDNPDGRHQGGTVIASLSGMDNAGVYVAASRHRDRFIAYASHDVLSELAAELDLPAANTPDELHRNAKLMIAHRARRTEHNANDQPVTEVPMSTRPRPDTNHLLDQLEQQQADRRRQAERDRHSRDEQERLAEQQRLVDADRSQHDRGFER